jgi:hypothetical protein
MHSDLTQQVCYKRLSLALLASTLQDQAAKSLAGKDDRPVTITSSTCSPPCTLPSCIFCCVLQDPLMQAQSAAAASSGIIRVPKLPVGAEASSSAAAAEAIVDARIAAGSMDEMDDEFRQRIKAAAKAAGVPYSSPGSSRSGSPSSQSSSSEQQPQQQQQPQQPKQQQQPQQGDKNTVVPWGEFFKSPPVWAVTVAHFCFNWGYYTLLAWLPSYFEMALGLNVQESSFLTLIPYVAMIAMTPVVSDAVVCCEGLAR